MSLTAVRKCLPLSRILSNNKAVLSNTSKTFWYTQVNSRTITRSLSFLCKNRESSYLRQVPLAKTCTCAVHTDRGDQDLAAFLDDEVLIRKKTRFNDQTLDGFQVNYSEADVTLTKKENDELIVIKSNVYEFLDFAEDEEDVMDPNSKKKPQEIQRKARPFFTVEITKHKKTLCFQCRYTQYQPDGENPGAESYKHSFEICGISFHVGEFKDSTYSVSGDIDKHLHDLLMIYLEDRGITNQFTDKMSLFFTSYNFSCYKRQMYINLLRGLKSFVREK